MRTLAQLNSRMTTQARQPSPRELRTTSQTLHRAREPFRFRGWRAQYGVAQKNHGRSRLCYSKKRLTPQFPFIHGWVYLLSGKAFPALTSKLALVGQARGGPLGRLRRSGTPLAIGFSERLPPPISPPLHPNQEAGVPCDFVTSDATTALQTSRSALCQFLIPSLLQSPKLPRPPSATSNLRGGF